MATPRLLTRIVALVAASVTVLAVFAVPVAADEGEVRLLVTFDEPVASAQVAATVPFALEADTLGAASTAAVVDEPSQVQVLELDSPADAAAATAMLSRRGDVVAIEEDGWLYAANDPATTTADAAALLDASTSWGVHNDGGIVGSFPGRAGIDIGARQAWERATGRGVVVAVIDTGVDTTHPRLRDRLWVNPKAATPRTDAVTGRTYVDDVHGWNFITTPSDRHGSNVLFANAMVDAHGTHVAGIIAGSPDPRTGYSPVAPDARLMVLKFLDGDAGRVSDAIAAVRYAAANGAHVINASWTSPNASLALRTTLLESGLPIVTSAGNSGLRLDDAPLYPAAWRLPNVISVAAIDHAGGMPSYSARSRNLVDVAAPGSRVLSTLPHGRLGHMSGTSQAAPHVTGALALALQRHPDTDPRHLADLVRTKVRPLSSVSQTRAGGIVRAPLLLDALGSAQPACHEELPRLRFTDVPRGSVHHDAVACLLSTGITQGRTETRFGASQPLTRAQVATLFARLLDRADRMPVVPATTRFRDLGGIDDHRDNIEALAAVGVLEGRDHRQFDPQTPATRAEVAAVAARTIEWLAEGAVRSSGNHFPDLAGHRDEALVRKASTLGIVQGRADGTFGPDLPVRRDQAAAMMVRMLDRAVQQGTVPR